MTNKEHSNARARDGRKCIALARSRAKLKGIPFSITHEYMMSIWPDAGIDFFGRKMEWKVAYDGKRGISGPNVPTIDRIDTSKGYVKGNVMWLASKSNSLKGGLSLQDWAIFLPWAIRYWETHGDGSHS